VLKIVDALDTFRGESRFLTWATKIAVRVAYTELRRARWRDVPLQITVDTADGEFIPQTYLSSAPGPEQVTLQRDVVTTLNQAIVEDLTDRQRQALVAVVLQGMPLEEVAQRMDSNRNALYKLLHDARQRLRRRLLERGLSAEEILDAFADGETQNANEAAIDGKR
jgi:RNA polymerase sigma-70 factor, ECF subfamily